MSPAESRASESIRVELDIFSGRPNPSWQLLRNEAEDFSHRLGALPNNPSGQNLQQDLGYRGLKVTIGALADSQNRVHEIVIGRGVVVVRQDATTRLLRDEGRALERWLLQTGKGRVEDEVYDYVLAEIQRGPG